MGNHKLLKTVFWGFPFCAVLTAILNYEWRPSRAIGRHNSIDPQWDYSGYIVAKRHKSPYGRQACPNFRFYHIALFIGG